MTKRHPYNSLHLFRIAWRIFYDTLHISIENIRLLKLRSWLHLQTKTTPMSNMNIDAFKDYVETRYKEQMEYYNKASSKNQKNYRACQWVLIVFSAVTPVIAALDGKWVSLQIPVVIISAVVAILTAGLKTFQYQELWVKYRSTVELLKPELYYYNFAVGPYAEEGVDKETLFVSRVETILDKEHINWPAIKRSQEDPVVVANETVQPK